MGTGIFFPLAALPFSIIIIYLFFSKGHVQTKETWIFKTLIVANFFGLILEILCSYASSIYFNNYFLSVIIYKAYLLYLILWISTISYYVYSMTRSENVINKKRVPIFILFYIVIAIILINLPIQVVIINDLSIRYTKGLSVQFTYLISGIALLVMLVMLIKNYRKVRNKKYLPIFMFLLIGGAAAVIQNYYPQYLLMTYVETLICVLMYFTIENPDLKMIESLNIAKSEAERANLAKSDFLASMSHEIRTPLNAITGFSHAILEVDNLPQEANDYAKDIIKSSDTLLEIVGGVLDVSKIESNMMEIVEVLYNPREEFEGLVKIVKSRIGEKPIIFNYKIAEDIPYQLYGDRANIKKIVTNLLTNAVKYTAKGQIFFNVKCINKDDVSYLIISVQDTGMGIKDEHISKLFTKFERLKVEKNTTVEGTGLGLAITKKLVELMGGKINVKSQYGVGSIFMTQIPQRIAMMSKPLTDTQMLSTLELKKKQDEEVKKINGQRILIVDDNSLNIKVAKIALKNFNLIVDDVSSGEECLKKVRTSPRYDLILMDIMMPEMSGEETFAELKKQMGFNVPVIALTADAVAGAKEKYLNQGFTSYISKPFSPEEIKSELVKIFK